MTMTLTKSQEDFGELVDTVSRTRQRVMLRGNTSCALLISLDEMEEIESLIETAEIYAIPGLAESIIEGGKTPIEDCIREEDIDWDAI